MSNDSWPRTLHDAALPRVKLAGCVAGVLLQALIPKLLGNLSRTQTRYPVHTPGIHLGMLHSLPSSSSLTPRNDIRPL